MANTLPAGLQRQAILQIAMAAFKRRILPLKNIFTTVFNGVRMEGTDKVNVPYYPLVTDASTDWNSATGYAAGNTTTESKEITVDKRKYQALAFGSAEANRQPNFNPEVLIQQKADKLAVDVITDILSAVTLANFGAAAVVKPASAWGSNDAADLRLVANQASWPKLGRSLVVNDDIDVELMKDPELKSAAFYGSADVIQQGQLPVLSGFQYVNGEVPDNSENLLGFISHQSAILVAFAPVKPREEVLASGTRYEEYTDPDTGLSLSYRTFGNSVLDTATRVIECNYGYAVGEAAALKRITSS